MAKSNYPYDPQTSTATYITYINHNDRHTHSASTRYRHLSNTSYRCACLSKKLGLIAVTEETQPTMTLQNIGFIKLFVILKLYMIHKHQQQRTPRTSTTTIVTRMRIYQVPTPQQHHLPVCLSLQEARTNCSQPRSTTNNDITKCFPKQIIRNIEPTKKHNQQWHYEMFSETNYS